MEEQREADRLARRFRDHRLGGGRVAEQRGGEHGLGRVDRVGLALEGGEVADEAQDRRDVGGGGGADHGTACSAGVAAMSRFLAADRQAATMIAAPPSVHGVTRSPNTSQPSTAA